MQSFRDKYWKIIDPRRTVSEIATELETNKDKYIHQMLRDSTAHPEREKGKNKENIYEARQRIIERLTYKQICDSMDKVVQTFEKELAAKNVL